MECDGEELLPRLPDDVALECLTRLHFSDHRSAASVCRRWRNLFRSKEFYYHRKKLGFTYKAACLVHALTAEDGSKPAGQQRYGISLFDPIHRVWDRVDSIPEYPDGLPMFCQLTSCEGKLIVMGGMDPASWAPVRDVFVFDFTALRWSRMADLPSSRSFFAVGTTIGGEVIVAGGHDESKNALNSAWILDVEEGRWREMPSMGEERDECEGFVSGSEFWVVSGYATDTQGAFKSSAEVYDARSGEWRRVEDCWRVSRCPRSCVGARNGGERGISLVCLGEEDEEAGVKTAVCGVEIGDWTLLTGAAYQGGPHGFYLMDKKKGGQKGKFEKMDVGDEFCGFVQSGCSIEI
ncbi:hypothetical protein M569_06729 [Genlisea aurea]|uniref:F-box domain-containing protein n=1 Tax=Genlisea aurea TaxID=192259 RepID=S8CMV0_9LAMI|nr:hypothetical protein M569_06729 [Genlisea aurea]